MNVAWFIPYIILRIVLLTIFMDHLWLSQIALELGKKKLMYGDVNHGNTFLFEFGFLLTKTADVHYGGCLRLLEDVSTL